jgi:hypothetical protein
MHSSRDLREQLVGDGASERVGVPVHQPPVITIPTEDEGEAQ